MARKTKEIEVKPMFDSFEETEIEEVEIPLYEELTNKPKTVKMTFDVEAQLAKEIKRLSKKHPHGFKKVFANTAFKNELIRLKNL